MIALQPPRLTVHLPPLVAGIDRNFDAAEVNPAALFARRFLRVGSIVRFFAGLQNAQPVAAARTITVLRSALYSNVEIPLASGSIFCDSKSNASSVALAGGSGFGGQGEPVNPPSIGSVVQSAFPSIAASCW